MRRWYKLLQFHVASGLSLSGAECRSITAVTKKLAVIRKALLTGALPYQWTVGCLVHSTSALDSSNGTGA